MSIAHEARHSTGTANRRSTHPPSALRKGTSASPPSISTRVGYVLTGLGLMVIAGAEFWACFTGRLNLSLLMQAAIFGACGAICVVRGTLGTCGEN